MSWFMRPVRATDIDALLALAEQTGSGFTNLPSNRDSLAKRIDWSLESYARVLTAPDNELYILLLEEAATGRIGGSAMLFSQLGDEWPFYSYKLSTLNQYSQELGRSITTELLSLVNDFNGASEVGGLFLNADMRTGGFGKLLSRSRYLFMATHKPRFADTVIAELRGWLREDGSSPFWDGLGRVFFDMPFQDADNFNSLNGNQFIADLMPKYPIYVQMLPRSARDVIGEPHVSGVPAMRLLEKEGFAYQGYIDIFDGGPTMSAPVGGLRTVRNSQPVSVSAVDAPAADKRAALLCKGELAEFRAWKSDAVFAESTIEIPSDEADLHDINIGDELTYVAA